MLFAILLPHPLQRQMLAQGQLLVSRRSVERLPERARPLARATLPGPNPAASASPAECARPAAGAAWPVPDPHERAIFLWDSRTRGATSQSPEGNTPIPQLLPCANSFLGKSAFARRAVATHRPSPEFQFYPFRWSCLFGVCAGEHIFEPVTFSCQRLDIKI